MVMTTAAAAAATAMMPMIGSKISLTVISIGSDGYAEPSRGMEGNSTSDHRSFSINFRDTTSCRFCFEVKRNYEMDSRLWLARAVIRSTAFPVKQEVYRCCWHETLRISSTGVTCEQSTLGLTLHFWYCPVISNIFEPTNDGWLKSAPYGRRKEHTRLEISFKIDRKNTNMAETLILFILN